MHLDPGAGQHHDRRLRRRKCARRQRPTGDIPVERRDDRRLIQVRLGQRYGRFRLRDARDGRLQIGIRVRVLLALQLRHHLVHN